MRWAHENDFDAFINLSSARWNVPVALIKATIAVESQFNPLATNPSDPGWAWGLMQMIPATAKGLGYQGDMRALLTDPAKAIDLGTQLLSQNLSRAGRVVADSVSAYNGGFRPTLGFGAVLPTGSYGNQSYVTKVLDALRYFEGAAGSAPAGGAPPSGATTFHPDRRPGMDAPRPVPQKATDLMAARTVDLGTVLKILEEFSHLVHMQISDPEKDKQRIARLDLAYQHAQQLDESPVEELHGLGGRAYIAAIVEDKKIPGGGSASGSKVARTYARIQQLKLQVHGAA